MKLIIIVIIIALLWDQKVFEKKGEKIDKYQDLKREIGNLWSIGQQEVALVVTQWTFGPWMCLTPLV